MPFDCTSSCSLIFSYFSSVDGRSILIAFSSLDDLVGYMYAFYDSMRIDMSLQFDLLPVRIRKHTSEQECAGQNLNTMETPEGATESISVECIAGSVPKVTEKSTYITTFLDRTHAESFAEGPTKKAEYFAEVFSMEAALFCKHSANNAFNYYKDFDDTFEMAFIDTSKTHSRTNDKPCETADVERADAESEVVDRNVLKQFPTGKKERIAQNTIKCTKRNRDLILYIKHLRKYIMLNKKGEQDKIRCLKQKNVQLNRKKDKMQLLKQMRSITKVNQNEKQD